MCTSFSNENVFTDILTIEIEECSEVDRGGARGAMAPPIIVPRPGNPEQVTNTLLWSPRVVSGAKI